MNWILRGCAREYLYIDRASRGRDSVLSIYLVMFITRSRSIEIDGQHCRLIIIKHNTWDPLCLYPTFELYFWSRACDFFPNIYYKSQETQFFCMNISSLYIGTLPFIWNYFFFHTVSGWFESRVIRRKGTHQHPRIPALSPALMIFRYPRLWFQSAGHGGIW